MTRKPNIQKKAPLMLRLSGQPALKVRLATSSKRDGIELAWAVNAAPTAADVWAKRTCEVASDGSCSSLSSFSLHRYVKSAPPLLRPSPHKLRKPQGFVNTAAEAGQWLQSLRRRSEMPQ